MGRGLLTATDIAVECAMPQGGRGPLRPRGSVAETRAAYEQGINPFIAWAFGVPVEEVDRLSGGPNTRPFGSPSGWTQRNFA
jgi:hypothetical protein